MNMSLNQTQEEEEEQEHYCTCQNKMMVLFHILYVSKEIINLYYVAVLQMSSHLILHF